MKIFILISLLLLTACDDGPIQTPTVWDLVGPDHAYEIDTWGKNSEIYEITPKSHTGKTCIIFILDNLRSTSMQCFDKPKGEIK